jgi:L-alanine-DL-glutamate epimerase-like enolase superfamily enzyme
MQRRDFVAAVMSAGAMIAAPAAEKRVIPWFEEPVLHLKKHVTAPVKIAAVELLQAGSNYFVKTTSTDGVVGVCRTKQMSEFVPIFKNLVAPELIGKDARDIEQLVDDIFQKNYKLAGIAFWCPVAYAEQSVLDLLGRVAKKRVADLLGGAVREEIPVYLSGGVRETTAEEEVEVYARGVAETGTKACKFKIGGRMNRNVDAYPGRTETMVKLARKRLGDDVVINADANGGYNAAKAIEVGKLLQDLNFGFFEEPCPFEELSETKLVNDALKIPIAVGEQDTSLWRFQWILENKVADIVQPDINYVGGFCRALRVARIARKFNATIVPHNTQTGSTAVNLLAFAAVTPNIGPRMEFVHRGNEKAESWSSPQFPIVNGKIAVPKGPGLGVDFDPAYLAKARVV